MVLLIAKAAAFLCSAIDLNDFGKLLKDVQNEMDEAEAAAIPKTQNELLPEVYSLIMLVHTTCAH